jgi:uncharacterized protein (DUF58 family)
MKSLAMNETYRQFLIEGETAGARYCIGAPRNIQRGLVGSQLGSRSGSSLEFMDHREYIPGDDLRSIDWNAFARSDKLSIKLYRDEVSPHVDVIVDCSRSMSLADSEKARATLGLAAIFAQAACNSDYTFAAWQVRRTCEKIGNGTDRPTLWDDIDFDSELSCSESFKLQMPAWKPKGIRILLSDLFWLGDPYETLSILAERASTVVVIQVLAESDANPAQRGNVRLRDCETNHLKDIFIDAVAENKYKQNLARHQYNWNRGCRQVGAVMATVIAEQIVDQWKLDELVMAEILKVL